MKAKQIYDFSVKLIIIGDSGVGKTNVILNFVEERFKDSYVATIGVDFKTKTIEVDNKRIRLQIWDTAGQERYRTITETYYKGAAGIILAYSIADRTSFENLDKWINQINQKAPHDIPKLIVANKIDLLEEERVVSVEDGIKLAEKHSHKHKIQFMEISAKTGKNVYQAFQKLAKSIKENLESEYTVKPVVKIITKQNAKSTAKNRNCEC